MIFGTDGIRAKMGHHPLDCTTIERLSRVLGEWLPPGGRVVLGGDTRQSRSELQGWVLSRLGDRPVVDLGIVPTPVVAFETKARGADLGIMLTASHNPAEDNGLKFFDARGLKLPSDTARHLSGLVEALQDAGPAMPPKLEPAEASHYRDFILDHFSRDDFAGLRCCFDLANGAGSDLVPNLGDLLGLDASFIGNVPNGQNINHEIGALHPQKLSQQVKQSGAAIGFALDGDGDRLIVVGPDEVHGDRVLYALYRNLVEEGRQVNAVVGTIMCCMGLEKALAQDGVQLLRTPVGDQNVLARMVADDLLLGGEPSGHLIQADLFPAGDGFLGALRLARALCKQPDLLQLAEARVPMYPTYEKSFRVARKPALDSLPVVSSEIAKCEAALAGDGRMIIRYSGTEPKLRVYIEAPDLAPYQEHIQALESAIAGDLM